MKRKQMLESKPPDHLKDLIVTFHLSSDVCDQNYKSITYLHKLQAGNRIEKMRQHANGEGNADASLRHATYVKK